MWNLKYGTNELIFEVETDSQTYRTDRVSKETPSFPRGGRD